MIPCKGCGKPITFGKTREGKTIPLEKMVHVYELTWDEDLKAYQALKVERDIYQSHFIGCPNRQQFSGSRR